MPRASATAEMHRCERVGAWPVILLAGGTLVVLVTSYVVLRVLGILSWRALGFAYHSVKMVVLIACKRLKEAAATLCPTPTPTPNPNPTSSPTPDPTPESPIPIPNPAPNLCP